MTAYRAVIDFTAAELAGLSEADCRALAGHRFIVLTGDFTFGSWVQSFAETLVEILPVNAVTANNVVLHAFRLERA